MFIGQTDDETSHRLFYLSVELNPFTTIQSYIILIYHVWSCISVQLGFYQFIGE